MGIGGKSLKECLEPQFELQRIKAAIVETKGKLEKGGTLSGKDLTEHEENLAYVARIQEHSCRDAGAIGHAADAEDRLVLD